MKALKHIPLLLIFCIALTACSGRSGYRNWADQDYGYDYRDYENDEPYCECGCECSRCFCGEEPAKEEVKYKTKASKYEPKEEEEEEFEDYFKDDEEDDYYDEYEEDEEDD